MANIKAIFELDDRVTRGLKKINSGLEKTAKYIEKVEKSLERLDRIKAEPKVILDDSKFKSQYRKVMRQLNKLDRKKYSAKVTIDDKKALKQIKNLVKKLEKLESGKHTIDLKANGNKAEKEIKALVKLLDKLTSKDRQVEVKIDDSKFQATLGEIKRELNKLESTPINIRIGVEDRFTADATNIQRILDRLDGMVVTPRIDINDTITTQLSNIQQHLDRVDSEHSTATVDADTQEAESKLDGIIEKMQKIQETAANFVLPGGAVLGGAGMLMNQSGEQQTNYAKISATSGMDYGTVKGNTEDIYYNQKVGNSKEEVASSIGNWAQQTDLGDNAVKIAAANSNKLAQLMGADTKEVDRSMTSMVKNLNMSSGEAGDVLAYIFKNAGDSYDDLLDTFNEYSPNFKELGISGEEAANAFVTGMKKGGRNYDDFADMFREFKIRSAELSKSQKVAWSGVFDGSNKKAEAFMNKVNSGAISGQEAILKVAKHLSTVTNKEERAAIASELLGSKYEDIGPLVLDMAAGLDKSANTQGELNKQFDDMRKKNPYQKMLDAQKNVEKMTTTIGDGLIEKLSPVAEEFNKWIVSPEGQKSIESITGFIADATTGAIEFGKELFQAGEWVNEKILTPIEKVLEKIGIGGDDLAKWGLWFAAANTAGLILLGTFKLMSVQAKEIGKGFGGLKKLGKWLKLPGFGGGNQNTGGGNAGGNTGGGNPLSGGNSGIQRVAIVGQPIKVFVVNDLTGHQDYNGDAGGNGNDRNRNANDPDGNNRNNRNRSGNAGEPEPSTRSGRRGRTRGRGRGIRGIFQQASQDALNDVTSSAGTRTGARQAGKFAKLAKFGKGALKGAGIVGTAATLVLSAPDIAHAFSGKGTDDKNKERGGLLGNLGGGAAGAAAGAAIGSVVPGIGTAIGGLIGGIVGSIGGEKIGSWLGENFNKGVKAAKGAWKDTKEWFGDKWKGIKDGASEVGSKVKTAFGDAKDTVSNKWSDTKEWFGDKFDGVKNKASEITGNVKTFFGDAKDTVSSKWSDTKEWFGEKFDGVSTKAKELGTNIKEKLSEAKDKVAEKFSPLATWFNDNVWTPIKDFASKAWDKIVEWAQGLPKRIGDSISNNASKALDAVTTLGSDMLSGISKSINGVIKGVNWVLDKVGVDSKIPEVPKYATGTNNHPGGPAIVGEEGRELAHIPGKGTTILGQNGPQMLNLPKGSSVLPNPQTEALLASGMPGYKSGVGKAFDKVKDVGEGIVDGVKNAAGKVKDVASTAWDYITNPSKLLEKFGVDLPSFSGVMGKFVPAMFKKVKDSIFSFMDSKTAGLGGSPDGGGPGTPIPGKFSGGVEQWRGISAQALRMTGQFSESNLSRLLMQMQTESGGNPNAINLWDSNAKKGIPSKGLMQVIDPTFRSYAMPGYNKNIYDPLSNILASIRYSLARYGSLTRAWRGHGYAKGGKIFHDETALVGENGPELVNLGAGSEVLSNKKSQELTGNLSAAQVVGVNKAKGSVAGPTIHMGDVIIPNAVVKEEADIAKIGQIAKDAIKSALKEALNIGGEGIYE